MEDQLKETKRIYDIAFPPGSLSSFWHPQQLPLKAQKISFKKSNYIIIGNSIYHECYSCNKLVKVNKFIFGSLHICTGE